MPGSAGAAAPELRGGKLAILFTAISLRKFMLVTLETPLLVAIVLPFVHLRYVLAVLSGGMSWGDFDVQRAILRTLLLVVISQFCFFFNDLYEWKVIRNRHQVSIRLLESCSYALILVALLYFAMSGLDRYLLSHTTTGPIFGDYTVDSIPAVVGMLLIWGGAYGYRRASEWTFVKLPSGEKVLMVGDGPIAQTIQKEIRERHDPTYEIVGYVLRKVEDGDRERNGCPILGEYGSILGLVRAHGIQRVIVALPERRGALPVIELLNCRLQGVKVEEGELTYERITGKIAVEKLRPSYLIFSEGFDRSKFNFIFKRTLDILLASVGLALSLPIILLTAIAIKLESRGPVIFSQARVGKEGRIFNVYKFRSMTADAEKESGPVWATTNDQRITTVGKYIRKMRIDEIPQLVNVLNNEMSFVGPRPERPFFVEELKREIPYYTERLVVKPGVTGWAQINYRYGASKEDAIEKLQYDLYYIKNKSIFLDVLILFRTVKVVLLGFGAR